MQLQDLRHSCASVGAAGDSLIAISKLRGHRDAKTTRRYDHLGDDPVKSVADRIAGKIAVAMAAASGEVVPLVSTRHR